MLALKLILNLNIFYLEWKFGLAKLIRNMQRTQVAPSPLNLVTTWLVLARQKYRDIKVDTRQ